MTNLFDTPIQPSTLAAGSVVYYADSHTYCNEYLYGLQTTKVMVSDDKSFILDNGKRFNPATGKEITRGNEGYLYPYTSVTKAMVLDAEAKLFLVNEVLSIDFSALTTQQLSMILDVSRGAFTQVTMPSPCGGGCGDTVNISGIDIDISPFKFDSANPPMVMDAEGNIYNSDGSLYVQPESEVTSPIAFNDASYYELSDSELDDMDDADEYDEYEQIRGLIEGIKTALS